METINKLRMKPTLIHTRKRTHKLEMVRESEWKKSCLRFIEVEMVIMNTLKVEFVS